MSLRNDHYYDPPDEPEANYCESCGKELDEDEVCHNVWCPENFTAGWKIDEKVAKAMAEHIVELEMDIDNLRSELRWAKGHKRQLLDQVNGMKVIIDALTQGQKGEENE